MLRITVPKITFHGHDSQKGLILRRGARFEGIRSVLAAEVLYLTVVEDITRMLWEASEGRRVCRITMKGEPLTRVVHPFGVCRTTAGSIVLVCWQKLGFTRHGGKEGYRNLVLEKIEEVEILESRFRVPPDFNPDDSQYEEWVYHI